MAKQNKNWSTTTNGRRGKPMKTFTLSLEVIAEIERQAKERGIKRSTVVEDAIWAAAPSERRPKPKSADGP